MKTRQLRMMQPARFVGAGSLGVMLYYITLYVLTEFGGVWYIASALIASLLNITSNFVLQKIWTFENATFRGVRRQVLQYSCMVGAFFCLNLAGLYALVQFLGMWYMAAQVILTAVITVLSFYISRRIFS